MYVAFICDVTKDLCSDNMFSDMFWAEFISCGHVLRCKSLHLFVIGVSDDLCLGFTLDQVLSFMSLT